MKAYILYVVRKYERQKWKSDRKSEGCPSSNVSGPNSNIKPRQPSLSLALYDFHDKKVSLLNKLWMAIQVCSAWTGGSRIWLCRFTYLFAAWLADTVTCLAILLFWGPIKQSNEVPVNVWEMCNDNEWPNGQTVNHIHEHTGTYKRRYGHTG